MHCFKFSQTPFLRSVFLMFVRSAEIQQCLSYLPTYHPDIKEIETRLEVSTTPAALVIWFENWCFQRERNPLSVNSNSKARHNLGRTHPTQLNAQDSSPPGLPTLRDRGYSERLQRNNLHTYTQGPFQVSSDPWAHNATYTKSMQSFGAKKH